MKKRTAFIGAILSLLPLGQPLIIKTGAVLSTTGLLLSVSGKVNAETVDYYLGKLEETYQIKGKEYRTIFYANEILKLNANSVDGYWYRAYALVEIGKYSEAIADYSKSIELGDNDTNTFNNRGFAKENAKDFYGAISDYNKAIKIDSENSLAYFNRGYAKESIGDMEGACFDWRKAFSLSKEDAADPLRDKC